MLVILAGWLIVVQCLPMRHQAHPAMIGWHWRREGNGSRGPVGPLWLSLFSGAELMAWGIYVVQMRAPLSHATSFRMLRMIPHLNLGVSTWSIGVGLLHCGILLLAIRPLRAIGDIACLYSWCALTVVSFDSSIEHPGITLYAMAAAAERGRPRLADLRRGATTMTQVPDGLLPPGIVDALTQAGKIAVSLAGLGTAVAWGWVRIESWWGRRTVKRRRTEQEQAGRDQAEEERQLKERQFYDERARREIARSSRSATRARREIRAREQQRDRDRDNIACNREGWVDLPARGPSAVNSSSAPCIGGRPSPAPSPPPFESLPEPPGAAAVMTRPDT